MENTSPWYKSSYSENGGTCVEARHWTKSSYSYNTGNCVEARRWEKSSYSANGGTCVEARRHAHGADMRDTENRDLGFLSLPAPEWTALLNAVRS